MHLRVDSPIELVRWPTTLTFTAQLIRAPFELENANEKSLRARLIYLGHAKIDLTCQYMLFMTAMQTSVRIYEER